MSERVAQVSAVFDLVADAYDQSGVEFFRPIAERLVAALDPAPGERAVDLGCGRGAVTLPLARAVGETGHVTAVDVSPAMVGHVRTAADAAGLGNVTVEVMDATGLTLPEGAFDLLASSLVLFFLPDPEAALTGWLRLLRPGGRAGVTTFGEQGDVWRRVDDLFTPYLPAQMLDARTSGEKGPFASDAGMERLMGVAGGTDVRTVLQDLEVRFADAEQWRSFSMSTGQRAMWRFVPEEARPSLFEAASSMLEEARDESGGIVLRQAVRHTLATRVG
jgi:ubiquinone/menaquinone biosynthesis C-methylase UbiE